MRRWRPSDVVRLAEQNAKLVDEAMGRALADANGGMPSGHGDGRTTLNKDGTPASRVQLAAMNGSADPVVGAVHRLIWSLWDVQAAAKELCSVPAEQVKKMTQTPGEGWCANPHCDAYCTGAKDDRLRSGRCDRCRKYRARHAGEEWRGDKEGRESAGQEH